MTAELKISHQSPVTLSVSETDFILDVLNALMRMDFKTERNTKSSVVRGAAGKRAVQCRDMEAELVRRMYDR